MRASYRACKVRPLIYVGCCLCVLLFVLPAGLLFFTTYTLLVLFWAEIYHQARSMPTGSLRPIFIAFNALVYACQVRTLHSSSSSSVEPAALHVSTILHSSPTQPACCQSASHSHSVCGSPLFWLTR